MKDKTTVTHIDFVFENCEVYSLPIENFSHINIIEDGAMYHCDERGVLSSNKTAKYVELCIASFENYIDVTQFGKGIFANPPSLKERLLQYDDIVALDLMNGNESVLCIYVPWDERCEEANPWQAIFENYTRNTKMRIIIQNLKDKLLEEE